MGTMRATRTADTAVVVAARAGDRRAVDELVTMYLPLVYTIVRRALGGGPDVDDVVQEIMLRAVRRLRVLRNPDSFRPWLAAIAVRHIGHHLRVARTAARRSADLDDLPEAPDVDADVEGLALLRLEVATQRRQVARASHWIDPDDRALLSLWWLEVAGRLTRTDLASALGVSVAHAGVRVQRMRNQLDVSRSVVAALDARPGCPRLPDVLAGWDGRPNPLWRKRIARHTRSCAACTRAGDGMVAAERLLVGFVLLPVPVALTATLIAKIASAGAGSAAALSGAAAAGSGGAGAVGSGGAGIIAQLIQAIGAHPVAATVAAGALVVGTTVTATNWPQPRPSPPAVVAAPTATRPPAPPPAPDPEPREPTVVVAPPPPAGPPATASASPELRPVSLEAVNAAGAFVAIAADLGVLVPVTGAADPTRERATFQVVPGLADPACLSLVASDGRYLRHMMWRVRLSLDEGTPLFRGDATFCVRPGTIEGSVSFESSNYPGWFLRHRGAEVWVDHSDGSAGFRADSSFLVRPPLAP
jgi:RNA polymerase sigma factor (sigma-70 family)